MKKPCKSVRVEILILFLLCAYATAQFLSGSGILSDANAVVCPWHSKGYRAVVSSEWCLDLESTSALYVRGLPQDELAGCSMMAYWKGGDLIIKFTKQ